MRLQATRTSVTSTGGAGDALYRAAGSRPTLDQRFAKDKSLVDKVSGQNLIEFTRASNATFVNSEGLIETAATNEPRFDHDPTTGESLGLLIEEGRTNLIENSTGSGFSNSNVTRVFDNTIVNPKGENGARKVTSTVSGSVHRLTKSSTSANSHVGSVFVKKGTSRYILLGFGGLSNSFSALFDIEPGITSNRVLGQGVIGVDSSNINAGYEEFPNDWIRIWASGTTTGSNGMFVGFAENNTTFTLTNFVGSTADNFYVWGFQYEDDAIFPTSFIETSGSTATRAADGVLIQNANFSSFYNQSSGTFVTTSSSVTNLQSNDFRGIFNVYQTGVSANTFRHYALYRAVNLFFFVSRVGGANVFNPVNAGDPTYRNDTLAYGYSSSEINKVFYDGSLITTSPSVFDWTTYTANRLLIGGSSKLNGHISRLTYFPTKRTDQELINVSGGDTAIPIITYGITSTGGDFTLRSAATVNYAVDWDSSGGYQESTSNALVNTYTAGDYELVVYSNDTYRPYFDLVNADVDQITSVVIHPGVIFGDSLGRAWYGGNNITSFECPFEATSNTILVNNAWRQLSSLTSFPLIDTSACISFVNAWNGCTGLTSFPLIQTSSGTLFTGAWLNLNNLVSFPQLNFSSAQRFTNSWRTSNGLANFPANMFDTTGTLTSDAFNATWEDCALTAQSIENILVSLDTNGQSNILLGINGGTNAAKTTWSTAANTAYDNLIAKGWTISFNA